LIHFAARRGGESRQRRPPASSLGFPFSSELPWRRELAQAATLLVQQASQLAGKQADRQSLLSQSFTSQLSARDWKELASTHY